MIDLTLNYCAGVFSSTIPCELGYFEAHVRASTIFNDIFPWYFVLQRHIAILTYLQKKLYVQPLKQN